MPQKRKRVARKKQSAQKRNKAQAQNAIPRENLISLLKASEGTPYSQQYLSLRARQGKLQALKQGRNWFTTEEWLSEYVLTYGDEDKREVYAISSSSVISSAHTVTSSSFSVILSEAKDLAGARRATREERLSYIFTYNLSPFLTQELRAFSFVENHLPNFFHSKSTFKNLGWAFSILEQGLRDILLTIDEGFGDRFINLGRGVSQIKTYFPKFSLSVDIEPVMSLVRRKRGAYSIQHLNPPPIAPKQSHSWFDKFFVVRSVPLPLLSFLVALMILTLAVAPGLAHDFKSGLTKAYDQASNSIWLANLEIGERRLALSSWLSQTKDEIDSVILSEAKDLAGGRLVPRSSDRSEVGRPTRARMSQIAPSAQNDRVLGAKIIKKPKPSKVKDVTQGFSPDKKPKVIERVIEKVIVKEKGVTPGINPLGFQNELESVDDGYERLKPKIPLKPKLPDELPSNTSGSIQATIPPPSDTGPVTQPSAPDGAGPITSDAPSIGTVAGESTTATQEQPPTPPESPPSSQ